MTEMNGALDQAFQVTDESGVARGTIDSSHLSTRERDKAERMTRVILSRMSPRGGLGLPRLLDERRLEYGITDGAFKRQATFDRVLVWQIPMQKGETFEGSRIIMSEATQQRERNRAPHGIVVSAGLLALDQLRSNGVDLGHRVLFCHSVPYHVRYDVVEGQEYHLIVLHAGDIIASEDLASDLVARKVRILQNPDSETLEHVLVDENGKHIKALPAYPGEE